MYSITQYVLYWHILLKIFNVSVVSTRAHRSDSAAATTSARLRPPRHHLSPLVAFVVAYMQVKWKGYDSDENSWEPEEKMQEMAEESVESYWRSVQFDSDNEKSGSESEHEE